jgi:hypothetical protein
VTSDCVPKTMGRNHIEHWCVEGSRVRPRGLTWHDVRALHTVTQMSRVLPLPHKKKLCCVIHGSQQPAGNCYVGLGQNQRGTLSTVRLMARTTVCGDRPRRIAANPATRARAVVGAQPARTKISLGVLPGCARRAREEVSVVTGLPRWRGALPFRFTSRLNGGVQVPSLACNTRTHPTVREHTKPSRCLNWPHFANFQKHSAGSFLARQRKIPHSFRPFS